MNYFNLSIFSNKQFLYLWLFHLLCLFGSELIRFALPIWFFQSDKNIITFSTFVFFGLIPRILSPLLGGAIDYLNKKNVLLFCTCMLILTSFLLILIVSNVLEKNVLYIYILTFLIGVFNNLIHITTISSVKQVVKSDNFFKANSLLITAESITTILSPLIASYLIFNYGISTIITSNIVFFFLGFFCILKIQFDIYVQNLKIREVFAGIIHNLNSGITFIRSHKKLLKLLFLFCGINFLFNFCFLAFIPMILSSPDAELIGKINSIAGMMQFLTLFLLGNIKTKSNKNLILKSTILLGMLGPLLIGIKFSPITWTIGYANSLILISIINSANNAIWQDLAPQNLQATIFGLRRMISSAIVPIGILLSGMFLNFILQTKKVSILASNYQAIFILSGFLITCLGLIALIQTNKENSNLNLPSYE